MELLLKGGAVRARRCQGLCSRRKRRTGYRYKHPKRERGKEQLPLRPGSLDFFPFFFLTGSRGGRVAKCVRGRVCARVGIETVCRKRRFQAEQRWQAFRTHFLCAARAGGWAGTRTHTHTYTHTHSWRGGRGEALARRASRTERESEGGRTREGGREFSREQHFPTVWGFDTWLSHIPQPCGRPSIGTRGEREREREKVPPSEPADNVELWQAGCLCLHVPVVCEF